ncbi:MAG: FAD-dependent oxidoreductase, partial [Prevotella sp.]|nr:FAD-dependent oxidoreductase [Prevotella sp.]
MVYKFDFLVIGAGIAGLSYALKVAKARKGKVCIICKTTLDEANTKFAQGGVASVTDLELDNFEKHIQDTMIAGDYISDPEAVSLVVRKAPGQIRELVDWGTQFDRKDDGHYDLHREGGHSEFRILHHADDTGAEIQRALMAAVRADPSIEIRENHFAVEIITQHHLGARVTRRTPYINCYGAYVLNPEQHVDTYLSKVTVMCTGGCGAVYQTTTNPVIATGDGEAMVYRAKGTVKDMEFVQFHPTSLFHPTETHPAYLITEAMRGYGGVLKLPDGETFMERYDPRLSLAPRDIVARAIDKEMKTHGIEHVCLDVTHKDPEETKRHFPNIYRKCLSIGIDITKDMIPVRPAAHYMCGGIKVDLNGCSSIDRLYAIGECSCTGLHGGNRLASNSLIEAVVYADTAATHSL